MHNSITRYFDCHRTLTDGFRKKRSRETQLLVTIHDIVKNLAQGDQVDVALLDVSEAFDEVLHR